RDEDPDDDRLRVAVIDALSIPDLEPLREPLELSGSTKAIHNASYDAVRLSRHLRIHTSPIHDTMLAARRSGERKCSLQAQAEAHLGLRLDKTEQRGDWGRRPLGREQLHYAAMDAACTLLLYEQQVGRGLRGDYELRERAAKRQERLPLEAVPDRVSLPVVAEPRAITFGQTELSNVALALLGIVNELSGRYSPEQLAASIGSERVGLAGWIIDRMIGTEADIDEGSARLEIASLCERGLVSLTLTRRLEATSCGIKLWGEVKQ